MIGKVEPSPVGCRNIGKSRKSDNASKYGNMQRGRVIELVKVRKHQRHPERDAFGDWCYSVRLRFMRDNNVTTLFLAYLIEVAYKKIKVENIHTGVTIEVGIRIPVGYTWIRVERLNKCVEVENVYNIVVVRVSCVQ